jgi:hypothetical protein
MVTYLVMCVKQRRGLRLFGEVCAPRAVGAGNRSYGMRNMRAEKVEAAEGGASFDWYVLRRGHS